MMQNDAGGRREDMEAELADLNNDIKELRNTLKALIVIYYDICIYVKYS